MKHPAAVTACNLDLENLITDVNRSIATLAITTLLKVLVNTCYCQYTCCHIYITRIIIIGYSANSPCFCHSLIDW